MQFHLRIVLFLVHLLGYVVCGTAQTFNRRYDYQGLGNAQVNWGLERGTQGYWSIGNSYDTDTIAADSTHSFHSLWLIQVDANGDVLLEKRIRKPEIDLYPGWANCCDTLPGGGLVIGGTANTFVGDLSVRAHLAVLDDQGDTVFTRSYGGAGQEWIGQQVIRTSDDGFLLIGQTDATGYLDAFVIKADPDGNEQWRNTYGLGGIADGFVSGMLLPDGGYILGGSRYPTVDTHQFWLVRIDASGQFLWDVLWGDGERATAAQITGLSNGNVLMAGAWPYGADFSAMRPYLAELDAADGSILWEQEYGGTAFSTGFFAAKECPNTDLIACGVSYTPYHSGLLLRATAEGDSLWMRTYYTTSELIPEGTGRFYDVLPTPDGGFIATGVAYASLVAPVPPGWSADTWVVKVDSLGCIVPGCNSVGITDQATDLLGALSIFPNPVSVSNGQDRTTVRLTLPPHLDDRDLHLSLVALDGRLVHRQRITGNGDHELTLQGLAAGVYHIHITSEGKWLTGGKLVVE